MTLPAWLDDLGTYLQTAGIGTLGTDIFYRGFDALTPNCIALFDNAGQHATSLGGELYRPGLGILVRNSSDVTADSKSRAIHDLLNLKVNIFMGTTRIKRIEAVSPAFFVSKSANNQFIYSINFEIQISGA